MMQKKKETGYFDISIFMVVVGVVAMVLFWRYLIKPHTVQHSIRSYSMVFTKENDDTKEFIIGKKHYKLCADSYVVWVDEGHGYSLQEFDDDDTTFKFDVDDVKDAYIEREVSKLGTVRVEFHIPENSRLVKTKD